MIDPNSPADKRFDLIKSIFSDRDEVEVFKHLPRNDAQAFVDGIDEVTFLNFSPLKGTPAKP